MAEKKAMVEFTEGEPTTMNVNISGKLTTLQYENVSYGASISLDLKKGADLDVAYEQGFTFLESVLVGRVKAVREKYPTSR